MKAIRIHQYGGPEVLRFEETSNPVLTSDAVIVKVAATSVNPIDIMQRSGVAKDIFPLEFPAILGVDVSGMVVAVGSEVQGFRAGDQVFAMANHTYAELCVVPPSVLAKIPDGLKPVEAAALPLVTTTGHQLISLGTGIKAGQTVLVTGAVGNVGRAAVFTEDRGARVIAGVLAKQLEQAANLNVDHVFATDDDGAISNLPAVDAVADTVGRTTAQKLLAKVKPGGVFASVLGVPPNARSYPDVKAVPVYSQQDSNILGYMAPAVEDGRLDIPSRPKCLSRMQPKRTRPLPQASRAKCCSFVTESRTRPFPGLSRTVRS